MRTSLVPGMLDMLAWNLNRDVGEARLFEIGSVYELANGERVEPKRACLGATAAAVQATLSAAGRLDVSKGEHAAAAEAFRGFKGDVENLLAAFAGNVSYDRKAAEYFNSGLSARALMNGTVVAQFGQMDKGSMKYLAEENVSATQTKQVIRGRILRQDVFVAEIDLEQLYKAGLRPVKFTPLGKYPAVERDFSFVFADGVTFEQMRQSVGALALAELRDFSPVEIFCGGAIPTGKYSVLLRARFQSDERTLRDDEVAEWSGKMVAALTKLGGTQRI